MYQGEEQVIRKETKQICHGHFCDSCSSFVTLAMSDSDRSARQRERAFRAHVKSRGEDYNDACPICLESLLESRGMIVVTSCNHAYHAMCWWQYAQKKNPAYEMVQRNELVTPADEVEYFFNCAAGPPCPTCRQTLPLLHELSGNLQKKQFYTMLGRWALPLERDFPLTLAEEGRVSFPTQS